MCPINIARKSNVSLQHNQKNTCSYYNLEQGQKNTWHVPMTARKSYIPVWYIQKSTCPYATDRKTNISSVLMRFLCKTRHKDSCAWPCLTWHCQPIKSAEYNQRETTIMTDWKPYLQQCTQIIKTSTLQTYFSYIFYQNWSVYETKWRLIFTF